MTEINNKPYLMAVLSGVAYKEPKDANKTFEKYGFHNHRFIDKDGAQCYVIWNDISAIICFRGTEPKEMSDVKADLNAIQRKGLHDSGDVHAGFQSEINKVWDDLNFTIADIQDRNIYITGHSLGGAMATICAKRLQEEGLNPHSLYTYGSPRVGDKKLIDNMNFTCYRIRNNNDIVTRVPPEWIGYTHKSDELFYFDVDGIPRYGFSRGFMFMQWLKGTYRGLFRNRTWDAFADHSMGDYYNLCKQQLAEENASN